MSDSQNTDPTAEATDEGDATLADGDLEQPSTSYEPGEEPTQPVDPAEPSHEAVGIGIVETAPLED